MKRIIIAGPVGAGKSTLGRILSKILLFPIIDLDSINWLPDWKVRSHEDLRRIVSEKAQAERWIVCGNYFQLRELTWKKADTVIWLDYSFKRCFWRCLKRAIRLIYTKQKVCGGNVETFSRLFSRSSVLLYLKKYGRLRNRYIDLMRSADYEHLKFVRLGSPKETEIWLKRLLKEIKT